MRKLEYQLTKEDYKNWIHWNVLRNDSKKMKILSVVIYIGFVAIFMGGNIASSKGNMAALIPSSILAVLVGVAMFYTTSHQNQERVIWKKSGLKRLERTNDFPIVHLTLGDQGITMEVPKQEMKQVYSYRDIHGILEIERLFLLEASDKTWQFVAKSAFESQEEMDEFKAFMEEKIEDAKENPEKYEIKEEKQEPAAPMGNSLASKSAKPAESGESDADEPEIEPVDVSNMGKIGKMAHIMAALAEKEKAEEAAKEENAAEAPVKEESAEENPVVEEPVTEGAAEEEPVTEGAAEEEPAK